MMPRRDVHTKLQTLLHENVNSAEISEALAKGVLRGETNNSRLLPCFSG